jgi:hypothetical protein
VVIFDKRYEKNQWNKIKLEFCCPFIILWIFFPVLFSKKKSPEHFCTFSAKEFTFELISVGQAVWRKIIPQNWIRVFSPNYQYRLGLVISVSEGKKGTLIKSTLITRLQVYSGTSLIWAPLSKTEESSAQNIQ